MGGLSWWHWLIIIAVAVMLFGAKRLPDAARGLGRSLRILKSEVSAMHEDDPSAVADAASPAVPTPTAITTSVATPMPVTSPRPSAPADAVHTTSPVQPAAAPVTEPSPTVVAHQA